MDGFQDNFVPNGNGVPPSDSDPAADFLKREQDELAGIEDAPEPAIVADPVPETVNGNDTTAPPQVTIMQGTPERVVTPVPRVEPEAIRIWREEHQRRLVEKDAAEDEAKNALKEKAKQELADWYKQHNEQVTRTRQANRCAEKELVADAERPVPGTEWERIDKLCDSECKTSKSSRDVSRMRSIIRYVKESPPAKS